MWNIKIPIKQWIRNKIHLPFTLKSRKVDNQKQKQSFIQNNVEQIPEIPEIFL